MTDAELLEGLFYFLLFLTGLVTWLYLLLRFLWFLVRPVYRLLFVPKYQRLMEDLTLQLNEASSDYLNETLDLLHKHKR